jgi:hypothetical protein
LLQRSPAEVGPPERSEGVAGHGADSPVNIQTGFALKSPQTTCRGRPVNAVDRRQVQAVRAQRNLKPSNLRPRRRRARRRCHDQAEEHKQERAATHVQVASTVVSQPLV